MSLPSETERVEAIRQILIQLYNLHGAGLHSRHISRIERESIFFLYESVGQDKFHDSRPHSKAARLLRESNPASLHKLVTYEHAIPLSTLRAELMSATGSTQTMYAFLKRFIKGVIITREEDKRLNGRLRKSLPQGAASHDMMARYREAQIEFEDPDREMLCENLELNAVVSSSRRQ